MLRQGLSPRRVCRWEAGQYVERDDLLVEEAALEISVDACHERHWERISLALAMRTPGDDRHLTLGLLYNEGIIRSLEDIEAYEERLDGARPRVIVRISDRLSPDLSGLSRRLLSTSSCGVCSQTRWDILHTQYPEAPQASPLDPDLLLLLPARMREAQASFQHTGGLHACALFSQNGTLEILCEDVGRHNALDKLIGHSLVHGKLPLAHSILLLSGRVSYELVQKAAMAGIRCIAAIGAPSSLACELADQLKITLVGFLRPPTFNIYTSHSLKSP